MDALARHTLNPRVVRTAFAYRGWDVLSTWVAGPLIWLGLRSPSELMQCTAFVSSYAASLKPRRKPHLVTYHQRRRGGIYLDDDRLIAELCHAFSVANPAAV